MANKEVCPTCGSPNKNTVWALCYRQANPWHKVDSLPVEATRAQDRTPQDYAIEHGEYLATAAENYQKAYNAYCELMTTADRDRDEELIDDARQTQSDCWSGLNSAIYEFRKRAKRAAGVEAKPASPAMLEAEWMAQEKILDYRNWLQAEVIRLRAKPASKEEQDGTDSQRSNERRISVDGSGRAALGNIDSDANSSEVKRFTIEVLQEKDGRWLADIPSVPGAMAYGKTEWEAVWRSIAIKWDVEREWCDGRV